MFISCQFPPFPGSDRQENKHLRKWSQFHQLINMVNTIHMHELKKLTIYHKTYKARTTVMCVIPHVDLAYS